RASRMGGDVIASEAKQSRANGTAVVGLDCFVAPLLAKTLRVTDEWYRVGYCKPAVGRGPTTASLTNKCAWARALRALSRPYDRPPARRMTTAVTNNRRFASPS